MRNILILVLFVSLFACEQKSEDQTSTITSGNSEQLASKEEEEDEPIEHITFNEPIESIPDQLKSFILPNYAVINLSSGDANLDGITDKIMILRKNGEEKTSNYEEGKPDKRPMLLLLGQKDSTYKIAYRNDNAVDCIDCDGMFGDSFTGTTIKNGYFSIEHGISGGRHWEKVTTFKYDQAKDNWLLYKNHYISYKMNDSAEEDAEALVVDFDTLSTVKEFGIIPFEKYATNAYNQ